MEIQEDGDDGVYVERIGVAVAPNTNTPMQALIQWCVRNEFQHSHRVELLMVHVRAPLRFIPTPMGRVPVSQVTPAKLSEHLAVHEAKTKEFAQNVLKICEESKVKASFVVVESDNIAKVLIEQIRKYELLKFIIGAPAQSLFRMTTGTSEYVLRNAPSFCSVKCISKTCTLVSSKNAHTRNYMSQPLPPTGSPPSCPSRRSKSSIYISISPGSQSPTNTMHAEELERLKWLVQLSTQETQPAQCVSQLLEAHFPSSHEVSTPSNIESNEAGELSYEPHIPPPHIPQSMHNEHHQHEEDACVDTDMPLAMEPIPLCNLEELKAAYAQEVEGLRRQLQEANLTARQVIEAANSEAAHHQKACEKALWALRKAEEMILQREQLAESMKKALEEEKQKRQEAEYKLESREVKCVQLSVEELSSMTNNFSPSNKIGENDYSTLYKGKRHHTDVAVSVLNWQERQDFQHKMEVLSRLNHPHILLFLGGSSEHGYLVYEYLNNGTLEDRLDCKNNTPPIPVHTRYRIAVEIASALLCLHKARPTLSLRGSVKPADVLLDRNFHSKLRIDRFISNQQLEDTCINPKAGVYSFGLLLLRLLTGICTPNVVRQVSSAVDRGSLREVLDSTVGEWPLEVAMELACIGLQCTGNDRPDLECVMEMLELTESLFYTHKKKTEAPSHFLCPISQEVMQNPVVAADGYTYEYDQISRWIETKDTSPMTNLPLENKNLTKNRVIKSAICEWRAKKSKGTHPWNC